MIENTSGEWGGGEERRAHTSTERPPLWPRQRCRGLEHTLAAEWFHLRISVITFRSVIYSWPLAAPHDPPLPQPFDQRKRQWLCKQALSVDSNGFTACFFSLVSLESYVDTQRNTVSSYRTCFSPGTNLRAWSWLEGTWKRGRWRLRRPSGRGESGGGNSLGALSSTACWPGRAGRLSSWEKLGGCSPLSWSSQTLWPVRRDINTNQRNWPSRVYNVCARSPEAESMWVP